MAQRANKFLKYWLIFLFYGCILVIWTVFNLLAGDIRDSIWFTLITVKTASILHFVNISAKNCFQAKLLGAVTVFVIPQPSMYYIVEKSKTFLFGSVFFFCSNFLKVSHASNCTCLRLLQKDNCFIAEIGRFNWSFKTEILVSIL